MNIKTFMALGVAALTAACSEAPATVTVDEAVQTEALGDDVTAPEFEITESELDPVSETEKTTEEN
jgi:V8-like Glu-specific endopeptidase